MNAPISLQEVQALSPSEVAAPDSPIVPMAPIVMRLQGGIGNQLFQLAYARRLSEAQQQPVAFDVSSFSADGYGRRSILPRLWHEAPVVEIASLPAAATRWLKEDRRHWPGEAGLPLSWQAPESVSHLCLDGYWQDHRVADEAQCAWLRQRLAAAMPAEVHVLAQRIQASARPTALHVRRRDYQHHGLCRRAYYLDALAWLAARAGPLDLFVWTDEPQATAHWLRESGVSAQLVHTGDDLADLWLMSQCTRHIIGNSSYSWWGARLAQTQAVIAPQPWSLLEPPSAQLLPSDWRRVPDALEVATPSGQLTQALDDEQFRIDREHFFAQGSLPADWQVQWRHCPGDATAGTAFDAHYVYHTAWAARRLLRHPVAEHVDIGSDLRFVTLASAFQPMRFLDYRPAAVKLSQLECGHANLLALDLADRSVASLSCMHVVEHIGLGRYGDPIRFDGSDRAMAELQRALAPGGLLYFVVPVGKPTLVFHAHRIFRASDIAQRFGELELIEFALVDDAGRFHEGLPLTASDGLSYGCGCFLFRRPH